MPTLIIMPHPTVCPEGRTLQVESGISICDAALNAGISIEHACERSCACTTCHVVVRQGFGGLVPAEEKEEDLLDKAWGLEAESRLSCQVKVGQEDLVVEIPKYTINLVSERR